MRPVFVRSSLLSHLGEPPESVFLKLLFCKLRIDLCIICSPISASPSGHFQPLPLFLSDPTGRREDDREYVCTGKADLCKANNQSPDREVKVCVVAKLDLRLFFLLAWARTDEGGIWVLCVCSSGWLRQAKATSGVVAATKNKRERDPPGH